jgi:hypothetical protein
MVAVISLLLVLGTSVILIRIAAVALESTGLSRDAARFQARSAFTGVGFTTSEAENVVLHPVRRRIVMWLMLVGNVGIVSVMAAVLVSAIDLRSQQGAGSLLAVLIGGLALLCALSSNRWVDRKMCGLIGWAIKRWTTLNARGYVELLHLRDAHGVSRFRVNEGDWISGKRLHDTGLVDEGLLVLGIERPERPFLGAPPADVEVRVGDELVVFGATVRVSELEARVVGERGDLAHVEAIAKRLERMNGEREHAGC